MSLRGYTATRSVTFILITILPANKVLVSPYLSVCMSVCLSVPVCGHEFDDVLKDGLMNFSENLLSDYSPSENVQPELSY